MSKKCVHFLGHSVVTLYMNYRYGNSRICVINITRHPEFYRDLPEDAEYNREIAIMP